MQVVDLFCGLGGFSAGALEAGADVVLGVDMDAVPLKLWGANVPNGRAVLATLGPGGDQVDLPPPSPSLHVHASSPCTDLSSAKNGAATAADVDGGIAMLRWALDLVLERGDDSWSLENVSTPKTRALLAEYRTRLPDRVAFATLDAADFGACQTRIRLIAAPPALIKLLQEVPSARRFSVREAFAAHGQEVPAPCFKNQTRNRDGTPCQRSVEEQSYTVCASHGVSNS
jgi:DNA (cytosine-5)-methyltransferase 1